METHVKSVCLDTSWISNKYAKQRGYTSLSTLKNGFTEVCNKSSLLDCSLHHGINHHPPFWSRCGWKFFTKTLRDPLYNINIDSATRCITIGSRDAGGEGVALPRDYALMTILHQLLPRQCFSLVNWMTYKNGVSCFSWLWIYSEH